MARHLLLVLSNPASREDEFNRWYDDIHVPEVLSLPGFVSAERHRVTAPAREEPSHAYCAIYVMDCRDPAEGYATIEAAFESGRITGSDALGAGMTVTFLTPLTTAGSVETLS